jgi:hypothetical protein
VLVMTVMVGLMAIVKVMQPSVAAGNIVLKRPGVT